MNNPFSPEVRSYQIGYGDATRRANAKQFAAIRRALTIIREWRAEAAEDRKKGRIHAAVQADLFAQCLYNALRIAIKS